MWFYHLAYPSYNYLIHPYTKRKFFIFFFLSIQFSFLQNKKKVNFEWKTKTILILLIKNYLLYKFDDFCAFWKIFKQHIHKFNGEIRIENWDVSLWKISIKMRKNELNLIRNFIENCVCIFRNINRKNKE